MTRDDSPAEAGADTNANADGNEDAASTPDIDEQLLVLPDELRHELKEPMGPIETDADRLLEDVDGPLIAVGDVVTYHFLRAGRPPDVALVDERTKRSAVDEEIRETVTEGTTVEVVNPPAEISQAVVEALLEGLVRDEPTTILVEGEEDLVALPAIVAAPEGASVVYGQPDEGMVHVKITDEHRADVRELLGRFEGDVDRFWEILESGTDA
ncbi:GTP-dependent dephospho-CoA kinase family protein [Haloterrigena sp. SYSU A558-1]|uniref:GTP-dependent dephospho-CoA kinase n=1 Tax=Haloterrigena gelatinilytica TaxID=2741724 RepID=A0A8J8KG90_9EURY|nr:GTP-dependent dephospho-CoA kinase family protein [Haloterrigena gelatinilytica]NUB89759.1 GTP-dependent dephospho-CoA kinase family protein [Haloterrigena gelatinilytica]NUC74409.1 GTP-dependent dephospho-CoA kinase family protein [Haloterrigena gelatinilytica]